MVITRFAPSPTGDPHIGNIRTALFAYLFAKNQKGKFLLRIEDTDRKRHDQAAVKSIKDALKWLQIVPDNIDNPKVQSEHLEEYKKVALKLVAESKAYVCICTQKQLKTSREKAKKEGKPPMYDKNCREKALKYKEDKSVIRMKVPENEKVKFIDAVRGKVEFDSNTVDDQVILKSDGYPTYHLAHVIDDHEMQVTHVIRSEEWLSSTPKHILLHQMLNFKIPQYAHLPIILGPNKNKLSKRDGAVGILEYRKLGYLPEALINFMAFLGWNPKDEREFFALANLEKEFDIKNVNKAGAIFDIEKLNFINRHYLQEKKVSEIKNLIDPKILSKFSDYDVDKAIALSQDRMDKISDFEQTLSFLLKAEPTRSNLIFKKSNRENTIKGLDAGRKELEELEIFSAQNIKSALEKSVEKANLSNGDVFWPVRVALSGLEKSPPPEQIAEALGKEEVAARINNALRILKD